MTVIMLELVASWLVTAMIAWVPLQRDADRARYDSMAKDIVAVAFDPAEEPVFAGDLGRAKTALLMASIASFESGYRADVDDGRLVGDHGQSFCIMQIRVGAGRTGEGWTGPDMIKDRQKCLRAGLHRIRTSFTWCKDHSVDDRLAGYTVGVCRDNEHLSRDRVQRAKAYFGRVPFTPPDDLVP